MPFFIDCLKTACQLTDWLFTTCLFTPLLLNRHAFLPTCLFTPLPNSRTTNFSSQHTVFHWIVCAPYVPRGVRWGAQTPPKNSKLGFTPPPKRSAHPSRVRRGCFDPPSPKIEAVGCANPYPPRKILNPRKNFFTQVGRNFKIFQFFYIFTNFIINEKRWN